MKNKKQYTFDVIREDSQDNKILIRYAHGKDEKFDTIYQIEQICIQYLKRNIYISTEILNS